MNANPNSSYALWAILVSGLLFYDGYSNRVAIEQAAAILLLLIAVGVTLYYGLWLASVPVLIALTVEICFSARLLSRKA